MDLSIIIVNYHNSHTLGDCLDSIARTLPNIDPEVILINNSPRDETLGKVLESCPPTHRIDNRVNNGFAGANNQGFEVSTGKTLLFLNPDTVLTDNSVENMLNYLKAHPETGLVAPKLLNPDGSLQYSCRRFPTLWTGLFSRYSLLTRLFPDNRFTRHYLMTDFNHNESREVDWVSGSCMMIPREAFIRAGKFDEHYFLFNEDVDLCRMMKQNGLKVVYYPDARVYHHISSSNRRLDPRTIIRRHRGMVYYYQKHFDHRGATRLLVHSLVACRCLSQLVLNLFK